MKLALNTNKGTLYKHPELGELPAQVAVPIKDEDVLLAESMEGVVVINEIVDSKNNRVNIKEVFANTK